MSGERINFTNASSFKQNKTKEYEENESFKKHKK